MVHYKVCSMVEGRKNFETLNWMVCKSMQKRKTLIPCLRVLVGEYYINNDNQHKRSEKVQASLGPNFIALNLVVNVRKVKKEKKFVQFVAIFHLLKHGRPMNNFEHMKGLLDFF